MLPWADRVRVAETSKCGHYGGCGCTANWGCCEQCPLSECHLDNPSHHRNHNNVVRDIQMRELNQGGMPVQELASRFSMSYRNAVRIISEGMTTS